MPLFRLYCLDNTQHITRREDFDAADDQAAVAYAEATHPDSNCEIWELGRLVARIAPSRAAAG